MDEGRGLCRLPLVRTMPPSSARSDPTAGSPERRLRHIDGLRAIAVLSVVAFHAWKYLPAFGRQVAGVPVHVSALSRVLALGYHGVDLFFVLSGYCLAYPTIVRLRRSGKVDFDVAHYLARRTVRIVPPYEVALAGFVIMLVLFARAGWAAPPDMPSPLNPTTVLRDAVLLGHGTALVNQSFWTLAVEWRWYFIFPFALWLWTRLPRMFWLVIVGCVVASYSKHALVVDVLYLPAFMLGIVAVHLDVYRPPLVRIFPLFLLTALAAAFMSRLPAGRGRFNFLAARALRFRRHRRDRPLVASRVSLAPPCRSRRRIVQHLSRSSAACRDRRIQSPSWICRYVGRCAHAEHGGRRRGVCLLVSDRTAAHEQLGEIPPGKDSKASVRRRLSDGSSVASVYACVSLWMRTYW